MEPFANAGFARTPKHCCGLPKALQAIQSRLATIVRRTQRGRVFAPATGFDLAPAARKSSLRTIIHGASDGMILTKEESWNAVCLA
jgi:hypothetical protein